MSYAPITDSEFLSTVELWLRSQPEILALIRYSHAAGNREFRLFTSFDDFSEASHQLPHLACVTVFRQPQLPIRGVVDDAFIARCLQSIPDGLEYLVIEKCDECMAACRRFTTPESRTPSCVTILRSVAALRLQQDFIRLGLTTRMMSSLLSSLMSTV